jgi:hypothetical protein
MHTTKLLKEPKSHDEAIKGLQEHTSISTPPLATHGQHESSTKRPL